MQQKRSKSLHPDCVEGNSVSIEFIIWLYLTECERAR